MKPKRRVDCDGLTLKPQNIDKHNWYYEEEKGLCFVHEVCDKAGVPIRDADQFWVPKRKLAMLMRSVQKYVEAPAC